MKCDNYFVQKQVVGRGMWETGFKLTAIAGDQALPALSSASTRTAGFQSESSRRREREGKSFSSPD